MAQIFANNASSTLASGVNDTDNTLVLATGAGALFPAPTGGDYFLLTLTQGVGLETSWEIVKCTARTSDTLTVTRAQESTVAASWGVGSKADLRLTNAGISALIVKRVTLSGRVRDVFGGGDCWQHQPGG